MVPPGNPKRIAGLADLDGLTLVPRQERSGSHLLLDHLLRREGVDRSRVAQVAPPARSEADVALAIAEGKADAGLAVETVARQFRLGFVPLFRERYDLAIWRRDHFEPPLQKLLSFSRTPAFQTAPRSSAAMRSPASATCTTTALDRRRCGAQDAGDHAKGGGAVKLSARNLIKGKVVEVKKGAVAAQVRVDIGGGNVLTSMITVDAVEDLGLKQGDPVSVVIKSTEVMLAT